MGSTLRQVYTKDLSVVTTELDEATLARAGSVSYNLEQRRSKPYVTTV